MNNSEDAGEPPDTGYQIFYTTGISIIAFICLVGNGLVIRCILTNTHLRKPNNYMILSLAFSDSLQGVVFFCYNMMHIYEKSLGK